MYSRTVFILLFTWFLKIRHVNSENHTGENKKANHTLNGLDSEWPVKVIKCLENKNVLKCFETILDEKYKINMEIEKFKESARSKKSPAELFNVEKLTTLMDSWRKTLTVHLKQEVSGLLKSQNASGIYDFAFKLFNRKNNSSKATPEADKQAEVTSRKMKMNMSMKNMIPYMLVPGLFLAGIMPWVVPQIKMLVMTVAMLNQVAFSSALFSLVRGYVFDTTQNEHIFYINHGYTNDKHQEKKPHKGLKRNDIVILKNPKSNR